jgi:hypothetical protein
MKLSSIRLSQTNTQDLLMLLSGVGLFLLFIWYGFRSTGTYYDDDIAHYLIARFSWQHPVLFLNTSAGQPSRSAMLQPHCWVLAR